ncbi:uncharacterized protein LOC144917319 [Branchiostoma floridae x Branchiostoma belcheri]
MGGTNLSKIGNNRVHPVDSDVDLRPKVVPKRKPKTAWSDKVNLTTKIKQTLQQCLPKLSKSNKVGPSPPESKSDVAERFLNLVPVEPEDTQPDQIAEIPVDGERKAAVAPTQPAKLSKSNKVSPAPPSTPATPNQPANVDVAVLPPQQPSREEQTTLDIFAQHSQKTREELLDKNITEMGYVRDRVPRDGNCLFEASARQLGRAEPSIVTDAQQLRHFLVRHIRHHAARYSVAVPGGLSEFHRQLDDLARPGHWSMDLGDTVPVALAELFSREVHLITSSNVLVVTPECELSGSALIMAYLDTPGAEHYDGIRLPGYR